MDYSDSSCGYMNNEHINILEHILSVSHMPSRFLIYCGINNTHSREGEREREGSERERRRERESEREIEREKERERERERENKNRDREVVSITLMYMHTCMPSRKLHPTFRAS